MERIINNIIAFIWLALFIVCLCVAIFSGACWHVWTALISLAMFSVSYVPKDSDEEKND